MRPLIFVLGLVSGIVLGAGLWMSPDAPVAIQMQCRPSAPKLLPETPKVLFWGNSLAFDHGWSLGAYQPVNCARQGLTAQAARSMTPQLPYMEFAAVVLVFGTVELIRGVEDTAEFDVAIEDISTQLQKLYPRAKLVVLGVPDGQAEVWSYGSRTQTGNINATLKALENTVYLDSTTILSGIPESDQTYDGVHLTGASYSALERQLLDVIAAD